MFQGRAVYLFTKMARGAGETKNSENMKGYTIPGTAKVKS